MIKINNKEDCYGCGACISICPKQCIEMCRDEEGFLYPVVKDAECVNCGQCVSVCPKIKDGKEEIVDRKKNPSTYAVINNDESIRLDSSSGGFFTLVAEWIVSNGGVVFGAKMSTDCKTVIHTFVDNVEDMAPLRGSKYVQSDIGDCFKSAKEYLEADKYVLFTGTPCQIKGLKSYLKKDYVKLVCMDFICHGVPSPKVWERYVDYRENQARAKTKNVSFRSKEVGWKEFSLLFEFSNGQRYIETVENDLYLRAFLADICLRPSCYECQFRNLSHVSDIIMADFWGINDVCPEINDGKGCSLVIANTPKGHEIMALIEKNAIIKEVNPDRVKKIRVAKDAITERKMYPKRKCFFEKLEVVSIDKLIKKYVKKKLNGRKIVRESLKRMGIWELLYKLYRLCTKGDK